MTQPTINTFLDMSLLAEAAYFEYAQTGVPSFITAPKQA